MREDLVCKKVEDLLVEMLGRSDEIEASRPGLGGAAPPRKPHHPDRASFGKARQTAALHERPGSEHFRYS